MLNNPKLEKEKLDRVLTFLDRNREFFSAPISLDRSKQDAFKEWAMGDRIREESLTMLTKQLKFALVLQVSLKNIYFTAIVGDSEKNGEDHNCLEHGDLSRLSELFTQHPLLLSTFIDIEKTYSVLIEQWYQDHSAIQEERINRAIENIQNRFDIFFSLYISIPRLRQHVATDPKIHQVLLIQIKKGFNLTTPHLALIIKSDMELFLKLYIESAHIRQSFLATLATQQALITAAKQNDVAIDTYIQTLYTQIRESSHLKTILQLSQITFILSQCHNNFSLANFFTWHNEAVFKEKVKQMIGKNSLQKGFIGLYCTNPTWFLETYERVSEFHDAFLNNSYSIQFFFIYAKESYFDSNWDFLAALAIGNDFDPKKEEKEDIAFAFNRLCKNHPDGISYLYDYLLPDAAQAMLPTASTLVPNNNIFKI